MFGELYFLFHASSHFERIIEVAVELSGKSIRLALSNVRVLFNQKFFAVLKSVFLLRMDFSGIILRLYLSSQFSLFRCYFHVFLLLMNSKSLASFLESIILFIVLKFRHEKTSKRLQTASQAHPKLLVFPEPKDT